jgi:predicted nucleotidyltransferase
MKAHYNKLHISVSAAQTIPSRTEAYAIAEKCAQALKKQFGAKEVYLFGSVIGESPWHDRSDLDIAVEGLAPQDYFRAVGALEELLPPGLELDLVTLESAFPEMAANIRGERKMSENPLKAMKQRIEDELRMMERVAQSVQTFLSQASEPPSELEMRGVASYLHDFYNGVERIFERIAVTLEGELPKGENWHQELLQQMEKERQGVRPAVIDRKLFLELLEYLRFRHRFRHLYGDELKWDKLRPLAEGVFETFEQLRSQLDNFENRFAKS